jgi:hypothetical protein
MYVVKSSEQSCCTCNHWMGTRVVEKDGFVYSLKNMEAICDGIKRTLTFPNTICKSWGRWSELDS